MHSFRKNTAEEFTIMLQSFLLFLFCNYYLEIFFMIFEYFVDLTKDFLQICKISIMPLKSNDCLENVNISCLHNLIVLYNLISS